VYERTWIANRAIAEKVVALKLDINVPVHAGYPDRGIPVSFGELMKSIRMGHTQAPPQDFIDYLNEHGFDWNRRDAVYERTWIANRAIAEKVVFLELDMNVPQSGYPDHGIPVSYGVLLDGIRTGNTQAPRDFIDYLNEHGFLFSQRNLAAHVAQVLAPTPLQDATGKAINGALVDFKRRHDIIRTKKGKKNIPFGKAAMTMDQIRARYNADFAKLNKP
jgi:hypothetical protein